MTPEQELTPPPRRRSDDAITGRAIRDWWQIGLSIGAAVAVGAMTYARFVNLEARVNVIEAGRAGDTLQFEKLNKRIDRIDRKLGLLICATDRTKCAADVLSAATEEP